MSSSSGQETKKLQPRFVPKIPVKKEKVLETRANVENSKTERNESIGVIHHLESVGNQATDNSNKKYDQEKSRNMFKINNNDRHNRHGGRGHVAGRDRVQWQAPQGSVFFTGNASSNAGVGSATVKPFGSGVDKEETMKKSVKIKSESGWAPRPNEIISHSQADSRTNGLKGIKTNSLKNSSSSSSEEDNSEDAGAPEIGAFRFENENAWPPATYDPLEPLDLPVGPPGADIRYLLSNQPLLAKADDSQAREYEEANALFLMQLPSDLTLDKNGSLLGRLQLMRSGKVQLVTHDGRRYNVSTGLTACFQQCLLGVNIGANQSTSATATSSQSSLPGASATPPSSISFMGHITKKVVVIPTYDLGVKKDKSGLSKSIELDASKLETEEPM